MVVETTKHASQQIASFTKQTIITPIQNTFTPETIRQIAGASTKVVHNPTVQVTAITLPILQLSAFLTQLNLKELLTLLLSFFNIGAGAVGTRKKQWGFVFDAKTGKPITGVRITITNQDNRSQTIITNGYGMYGMLVPPGTYTLQVDKDNYTFPSTITQTSLRPDRSLANEEEFTFTQPSLVNFDIALDPKEETVSLWNGIARFYLSQQRKVQTTLNVLTAIGFVITLILFFVVVLLLRSLGLGADAWGEVTTFKGDPLRFATLELINAHTKRLAQRAISDEYGRYYLFADKGDYLLDVHHVDSSTGTLSTHHTPVTLKKNMQVVKEKVKVRVGK